MGGLPEPFPKDWSKPRDAKTKKEVVRAKEGPSCRLKDLKWYPGKGWGPPKKKKWVGMSKAGKARGCKKNHLTRGSGNKGSERRAL